MKMKTQSILPIMLIASALAFTNCSGKKEEAKTEETTQDAHASGSEASMEASKPQFEVDVTFQKQLATVYTSYVGLKEAFVASDAAKVKAEAVTTQSTLATVDMKLVTGAAHNDWMNYLGGLESSLKEIQATDDIEAQRKAFSTLTDNLYKSAKAFGLGGTTAYYEFCPMAFNNEGGFWLSSEEKIRNPYFGDKMLTCGTVKEKLQ
jgi:Cu(I)/Ag(I) efflux system membrane fusion protein